MSWITTVYMLLINNILFQYSLEKLKRKKSAGTFASTPYFTISITIFWMTDECAEFLFYRDDFYKYYSKVLSSSEVRKANYFFYFKKNVIQSLFRSIGFFELFEFLSRSDL